MNGICHEADYSEREQQEQTLKQLAEINEVIKEEVKYIGEMDDQELN